MRTLQEKYDAITEGNFSKEQFRRDAQMQLPNLVSKFNSFEDTVNILKNRGMIAETKAQEPKYSTAKPEDTIAPDVLDTGIKFELDKKYGTLDVTDEQYAKCREMAIKNLAKDVLYYVKQDSIQLPDMEEKMEKVKLNEDAKAEAWEQYKKDHPSINSNTEKGAYKHFEDEWNAKLTKDQIEHDEETYRRETSEEIQNIESDEQTKKRIAGLTNQLLQDADPRDEYVKAYAVSVKRDLESGDTSRMSQYKNILSLDDLKDDMEHYLTHDVDQLEEGEWEDKGQSDELNKERLAALKTKKAEAEKKGAPKGIIATLDKQIGELEALVEEDDLGEPDTEDLYQHDDEYLATLKQRKALKETIKKIIAKVITE